MARALLVATCLLLASTLAGCAILDGGADRKGDLVRIVVLDVDPDDFEDDVNDAADVFAALADTRFEYTHDQDTMDAGSITVEYTDEGGRGRTAPLSDFTEAATVGKGDKVTIDGVLLTSSMKLTHGGDTLASRGGPTVNWLEAGGYPLPLALDGGLAEWDVDGDFQLDGEMDRLEVVDGETDYDYACDAEGQCSYQETPYTSTLRFTDATADANADLDAKLVLDSVGTSSQPALELGMAGTWVMDALFNVHVYDDSTLDEEPVEADYGFDLDLTATGDGALTLRFERDGSLRAAGAEGDLDVEGSMTVWDDEHAREEGYSPEGLDDIDFHAPYEEEEVDLDHNPVAFVAQALADLWRMDLAPGDEFHFTTGDRFGEDMPRASVTIRVISEARKSVPAGTFTALRVETTSAIDVPVDGAAAERFELPTLTTWIDSESGIPIAVLQEMAYDYDQDDFAPLFAAAESFDDDMTITPPEVLHIGLDGRTLMELSEWKDGMQVAPMASVLMPLVLFASPFASWMVYPLFGYGMAMDEAYPAEAVELERAPDVAFSTDETRDRITLVLAESDLVYGDFDLRSTRDVRFARNAEAGLFAGETVSSDAYTPFGPYDAAFQPGDYLDFCTTLPTTAPTTFSVRHVWTNTLVYETSLASIAVCA
jgi:hypothetical protein